MALRRQLAAWDRRLLGPPAPAGAWAPYDQLLAVQARALAVGALVLLGAELYSARAFVLSPVFLAIGLVIGALTGRVLAGGQDDDLAEVAPVEQPVPLGSVRPSALSVFAVMAGLGVLVLIELLSPVPTILPGVLAAFAVQSFLQRRGLQVAQRSQQLVAVLPADSVLPRGRLRVVAAPQ